MWLNQIFKQFVKHGLFVYVGGIRVINAYGVDAGHNAFYVRQARAEFYWIKQTSLLTKRPRKWTQL